MKTFIVTVRYQFPAWSDKNGIESEPVQARDKAEAIKYARRQLERDGHAGIAVCKGLQWFKATELNPQ